jgi:methylmalonyl-CoA/ethylmalonyl-CoA epimerase
MIKRIHHINFIVRDLEKAAGQYRKLLGDSAGQVEELPERGVRLVRFKLGETWIVLVQPVNSEGVPAQYLEQYGEGFFLVSCEVDDVKEAAEKAIEQGIRTLDKQPRQGLDDWRVMDLDPDDLCGVNVQLVQTGE